MSDPARSELVGVLVVDAGIAVVLCGLIALLWPFPALRIASRKRAAAVSGAGLLLAVTGALLPARERAAAAPAARLDDFVPRWQFAERHEIRVHAPPARVESAVRDVTAGEIRLFRLLTWLRNPPPARQRHARDHPLAQRAPTHPRSGARLRLHAADGRGR